MTTPEEEQGHETEAAATLRKTLRMLVVATVVLYIVLVAVCVKVYLDGRSTHNALCTFQADRITQVTQSLQFLADHPEGTSEFPVEAIVNSVNSQIGTINALSSLNCVASQPVPTPISSPTPKGTP